MVRLAVNAERSAQWFSVWLEFSCVQVKCYVKEVDNLLVYFDGDFQIVPRKYLAYLVFCSLYLPWCLVKYRQSVVAVKADFDARYLV